MGSSSVKKNWRTIGWNNLQFSCPVDWEVTVSSACHLLVEEELAPVFELRWDTGNKGTTVHELVQRSIEASQERVTLSPVELPDCFTPLPYTDITALSSRPDLSPELLFWYCEECGSVFLCHLHRFAPQDTATLASVLCGLKCHQSHEGKAFWSLQDFQLKLSSEYQYRDSSFQAGLSRLAFSGNGLELQYCRLAPADARLQANEIKDILNGLIGSRYNAHYLVDDEHQCCSMSGPTGMGKLMACLRRKPLYCWAKMWHIQSSNRLLALVIHSRHPIDPDIGESLSGCYEIVPLQ